MALVLAFELRKTGNYIPPFGSSQQEVEKKETFGASNIRLEGDEKTSHPEVTCFCWNR